MKTMDLSFCTTSWNGKEFMCIEPEMTKKCIGYYLNTAGDKDYINSEGKIVNERD